MALCSRVLRLNLRVRGNRTVSMAPTENIFAEEENALTEEQIESKRNIARTNPRMYTRKIKKEYTASQRHDWTIKGLRRDYATFGTESGINPGVCWPNKEEIVDLLDLQERYTKTFDQLKQELDEKRAADRKFFATREATLEENLSKLKHWREEMLAKEEKVKQQEAVKRAKLDELIREVREHIGYNLDPSDPKFKEVMEMKENERKLAEKEAKKQAKKEKMMQRLMAVPKIEGLSKATASTPETKQSDSETSKSGTEPPPEK